MEFAALEVALTRVARMLRLASVRNDPGVCPGRHARSRGCSTMKGQLMLDGMGTAAPAAQTALTASDLRISVIIPLFNRSKYIRETLMSVLGQRILLMRSLL